MNTPYEPQTISNNIVGDTFMWSECTRDANMSKRNSIQDSSTGSTPYACFGHWCRGVKVGVASLFKD